MGYLFLKYYDSKKRNHNESLIIKGDSILNIHKLLKTKCTNKLLYFVIAPLFVIAIIMMVFFLLFRMGNSMNSDIASEILLGKEILIEHKIFPTGWFYPTELRFINIQLMIAPLIKLTGNMILSKAIANLILIILFCLIYWYFMKSLKVDKTYSLLMLVVMISPFSYSLMYNLYSGAFYTPYLIFIDVI